MILDLIYRFIDNYNFENLISAINQTFYTVAPNHMHTCVQAKTIENKTTIFGSWQRGQNNIN